MTIDPAILLGPIGLTAFLLYAVKRLWDDHSRNDERREAQLERHLAINEEMAKSIDASTEAIKQALTALTRGAAR